MPAKLSLIGNKLLRRGNKLAISGNCCCYGPPPPPPDPPDCGVCTAGTNIRRWKLVVSGVVFYDGGSGDTTPYCPLCEDRNGIFFLDNYNCDDLGEQIFAEKDLGPWEGDGSGGFRQNECAWYYGQYITEYCGNGFGTDPGGAIQEDPATTWIWGLRLSISGGGSLVGVTLEEYNKGWGFGGDDPETTIDEQTSVRYHACTWNSSYSGITGTVVIGAPPVSCSGLFSGGVSLPAFTGGGYCDWEPSTVTAQAIL